MTSRPVTLTRSLLFRVYYRLPVRWRQRLVRLGTVKWIIGAVVLVCDESDGQLLLVRQPSGRRRWSLPAGLLKRGERPAVGAARELYEETGVRLDPDGLTPAQPNAVVHVRGRWVDMVFRARVPDTVKLVADGAEIVEVAWHPLAELPPLTGPAARLLAHYGIGPETAADD